MEYWSIGFSRPPIIPTLCGDRRVQCSSFAIRRIHILTSTENPDSQTIVRADGLLASLTWLM